MKFIHKGKQSGFGVLELLLTTGILTVLILTSLPSIQRYQERQAAETFKNQVVFLWEAIKSYQADRYNVGVPFNDISSLPASYDDLVPNYIQTCSNADNIAGRCSRADLTPMGETITMQRENILIGGGQTVPGMLLTIPFGAEPSESIRNTYRAVLADLPNGVYDEGDNKLEIRFGRVGSEVEHQALLARDGTTTLTGDWDVGNKAILNASMVTVRGQNGNQIRVDGGVVHSYSSYIDGSGIVVPKSNFTCPTNLNQDVQASLAGIKAHNSYEYLAIGEQKLTTILEGGEFKIRLKYKAKQKQRGSTTDKGAWVDANTGWINILYLCVP
ncbi:hypothetical protein OAA_13965 [Vibrio cyclitrophicus 1F175]|uniref:type II secretion system protein n=1 Tax=Vibrio cyclitrophicus TaxID=47951 RepID=UPI000306FBA5|nr:type II secretion system protein [Vibrio cyclitrophicus]OEF63586.1 hypothetical protein OAA_13965 [Vibrio cyclitrophicus 1F175]